MSRELKGKEVWITADGRIRVRGWFGWHPKWREVSSSEISLNEYYPDRMTARGGIYYLSDIGLDFRDISRMFGISRLDNKRAAEIWNSPSSVRGEVLAVDFAARELVLVSGERAVPGLVNPFNSIKAVRRSPEPQLVKKFSAIGRNVLSIRSFPMGLDELAGRMGVPLEDA